MIKLSVAFVAYNNYFDLIKAIESVESHTSKEISKQIFIVDNSSSEKIQINERNQLLEKISELSDVQYLAVGENLGFGKGNNFVIPFLNSEYHAIVNPDVLLVDDVFSKLIDFMDTHEVGMCIPRIIDMDGYLQPVYRREVTVVDMFIRLFCKGLFKKREAYHTMQDMDYTKPFQVPFGQGSFLLIRTGLFKKLNGFDDRYFMYMEDADLCKRVNQESLLMFCPNATVIHKWEKGSHKDLKLFRIHINSMYKYFKKWGLKIC